MLIAWPDSKKNSIDKFAAFFSSSDDVRKNEQLNLTMRIGIS